MNNFWKAIVLYFTFKSGLFFPSYFFSRKLSVQLILVLLLFYVFVILFFAFAVTFDQVQDLLRPIVTATEQVVTATEQIRTDMAIATEQIRTDMAAAEIRRVRKELNCWVTNYRTLQESSEFKHEVIRFYGRGVSVVGDRVITARCMVSNAVVAYSELRPAHLVKHSTPHLMTLYGLSPLEIDNPRNGILILDSIEKAFDHLDVCFLYNAMTQVLTFKVMNPTFNSKRILPYSSAELRTFGDIDGNVLQCAVGCLPYMRVLSVHTKFSFSRALSMGWIKNTEALVTYFNVSETGLREPECIRDLTWEQMNYTDIITTI
jgi:hypothetical protein